MTIVGRAAKPSATILKKIATLPTLVINHRIKPTMERKPHHKSNLVSFHSASLLTKEARKILSGPKPVLKVMADARPTPWLIWAEKAISGAKDHNKKETLLGLTLPLIV